MKEKDDDVKMNRQPGGALATSSLLLIGIAAVAGTLSGKRSPHACN